MFFFDQNINVEADVAVANDFRLLQMSFANGLLMTSKRASKCSWLLQMTNGFAHGKCSWLLMANFALLTTMMITPEEAITDWWWSRTSQF